MLGLIMITLVISMLTGCGALIGGTVGAVFGQAAGGDTESTTAGAAYGAAVGTAIEYEYYRHREHSQPRP